MFFRFFVVFRAFRLPKTRPTFRKRRLNFRKRRSNFFKRRFKFLKRRLKTQKTAFFSPETAFQKCEKSFRFVKTLIQCFLSLMRIFGVFSARDESCSFFAILKPL